jgi:hypothetical protein
MIKKSKTKGYFSEHQQKMLRTDIIKSLADNFNLDYAESYLIQKVTARIFNRGY